MACKSISAPIIPQIDYLPTGVREIFFTIENSTNVEFPLSVYSVNRGYTVVVESEKIGRFTIPSPKKLVNSSIYDFTWRPGERITQKISANTLSELTQGDYRISIFWNAQGDKDIDHSDFSVTGLSLKIDASGECSIESDVQTAVKGMTVEAFQKNHPSPLSASSTSPPFALPLPEDTSKVQLLNNGVLVDHPISGQNDGKLKQNEGWLANLKVFSGACGFLLLLAFGIKQGLQLKRS